MWDGLISFLWAYGFLSGFWVLYVFVMGLYRAKLDGSLTRTAWVVGFPWIVLAILVDWVVNWTIATLLFWDLPRSRSELVTGRFQRYLTGDTGWRAKSASWVCSHLLDYLDPRGHHCKGKP